MPPRYSAVFKRGRTLISNRFGVASSASSAAANGQCPTASIIPNGITATAKKPSSATMHAFADSRPNTIRYAQTNSTKPALNRKNSRSSPNDRYGY